MIPQMCLMPYYILQVGATGLLFILTLILGFDLGRFRHRSPDERRLVRDG